MGGGEAPDRSWRTPPGEAAKSPDRRPADARGIRRSGVPVRRSPGAAVRVRRCVGMPGAAAPYVRRCAGAARSAGSAVTAARAAQHLQEVMYRCRAVRSSAALSHGEPVTHAVDPGYGRIRLGEPPLPRADRSHRGTVDLPAVAREESDPAVLDDHLPGPGERAGPSFDPYAPCAELHVVHRSVAPLRTSTTGRESSRPGTASRARVGLNRVYAR